MTNPSRENDNRECGPGAQEAPVAPSPETGTQAPIAKTFSGTAGAALQSAPRQFTATDVFTLLVKAIGEFESTGKTPTAAGVSARMRVIEPDFSIDRTEFSTFRGITKAAEGAALIEANRTSSDYVLKLVSVEDMRGVNLRPDLWRAIQDWTDGVRYAFDRTTKTTEQFVGGVPSGSVEVPSVDKATLIEWMNQFASRPLGELNTQLAEALREDDPVSAFHGVIRGDSSVKRRWNRRLRSGILDTAVAWSTRNAIPRRDIFTSIPAPTSSSAVAPTGLYASPSVAVSPTPPVDVDLRRRILSILDSMPLHELLRLPIPLEHSLNR
ncbi:hypothetical protein [Arthrobacter halodurans]|uniref:Uncharacterized protein n=1 Tax=Arthrobacter halodurans TaxID=516699 RepID=A0ABV4UMV0_9MICC